MRIVAGRHRGRRLLVPPGRAVRPTADRIREALFNVLQHSGWGAAGGDPVAGAVVLDAFCGTGALGLEALSRGAAAAWFIDLSPASLAATRSNVVSLGDTARATLLKADATRPPAARAAATLAFLDPPYAEDLAAPALAALAARGWLAAGCLAVVEHAGRDAFAPPGFAVLDERRYGDTRLVFLRLTETAPPAPGGGRDL